MAACTGACLHACVRGCMSASLCAKQATRAMDTANLRTKILDFRGFDSSRILIWRGGIVMSIGDFPEGLSQAILVGIMLVGRLGVMITHIRINILLMIMVRLASGNGRHSRKNGRRSRVDVWCSWGIRTERPGLRGRPTALYIGRGGDTLGNPHRAQIYQFELFELILCVNLDKQLSIEQFEATVSQSTVPPLLKLANSWCAGWEPDPPFRIPPFRGGD